MHKNKALVLLLSLSMVHLNICEVTPSIHPLEVSFELFEPVLIAELWRSGAKVPEDLLFADEFPAEFEPGSLQPNGMRS